MSESEAEIKVEMVEECELIEPKTEPIAEIHYSESKQGTKIHGNPYISIHSLII